MRNQTGTRSREAILQTLLDDLDCDDDTALAIAGGGRKADVRWRRHGIYRVIRLREADAIAWDIPATALRSKIDGERIDEITAVTWAVMKYFGRDNEAAMNKAGLADLPQWRNDGYAPMARAIWERAVALTADEATEWRDRLDRQMAMAVGKRSRRWIEKLVQQITVLRGLSSGEALEPPGGVLASRSTRSDTAVAAQANHAGTVGTERQTREPSAIPSFSGQDSRGAGAVRLPKDRILSVMLDAYQPCPNFGTCREAKWDPESGHVPRGILGATRDPADVETVMVFSEPGHPLPGEGHDVTSAPRALLQSAMQHTYNCYKTGVDQFHRNVRWFLSQLHPDLSFDEQLRYVWLTEGRLCSIDDEIGRTTDRTCASRYLVRQIEVLPRATVVAFGRKAQHYLRGIGVDFVSAHALSPPGANFPQARPTWQAAIEKVRDRRVQG